MASLSYFFFHCKAILLLFVALPWHLSSSALVLAFEPFKLLLPKSLWCLLFSRWKTWRGGGLLTAPGQVMKDLYALTQRKREAAPDTLRMLLRSAVEKNINLNRDRRLYWAFCVSIRVCVGVWMGEWSFTFMGSQTWLRVTWSLS